MLWIRGLAFTILVPGFVAVWVPRLIYVGSAADEGLWSTGWLFILIGAVIYSVCLYSFLISGGTPAIFFTRHVKRIIGEEPSKLVRNGLYRFSRNPMYVGVLLAVIGQAIVFASLALALYAVALWLSFHFVVVFLEEPHLRKVRGPSYDEYCRHVPRWLGWPQ